MPSLGRRDLAEGRREHESHQEHGSPQGPSCLRAIACSSESNATSRMSSASMIARARSSCSRPPGGSLRSAAALPASSVQRQLGNPSEEAVLGRMLCRLDRKLGRLDEAREETERAERLCEASGAVLREAQAWLQRGRMYLQQMKKLQLAHDELCQALESFNKLDVPDEEAIACAELGRICMLGIDRMKPTLNFAARSIPMPDRPARTTTPGSANGWRTWSTTRVACN